MLAAFLSSCRRPYHRSGDLPSRI